MTSPAGSGAFRRRPQSHCRRRQRASDARPIAMARGRRGFDREVDGLRSDRRFAHAAATSWSSSFRRHAEARITQRG